MKFFKKVLHNWFAVVSIFSFLAGWAMLAHSLKPVQPTQSSAQNAILLPALPPINAFGNENSTGNGLGLSVPANPSNLGFPRLRTGGS
jgi:hypothetical protein